MKKFSFLLILVTGLVMFTACPNKQTTPPTISTLSSITVDLYALDDVVLTGSIYVSDGETISDLTFTSNYSDGSDATFTANPGTSSSYDFELTGNQIAAKEGMESVVIYAQSSNGLSETFTVSVSIKNNPPTPPTTPLSEPAAFEWVRHGGNPGTGLAGFGLQWTGNGKAVNAIIKPVDGAKLVELAVADWTSITTKEALKEKVDAATALTDYRKISAEATHDYDLVIATCHNQEYYMINIKHAAIQVLPEGTTITITGNSKN